MDGSSPGDTLTMNLELIKKCDIRNTELVAKDGQTSYQVVTPWKFGSRTSTIWRRGEKSQVIGEVEWHCFSQDQIRIGNGSIEKRDYIRGSRFSKRRRITASDGREYEWRAGYSPELFTTSGVGSPVRVAYYRKGNIFVGRKPQLVVLPEGMNILDSIVLSFVLIEKMRQDRRAGG